MAPTFPLSLPAVGYDLCEFSLERQVVGARLRSGAAQRIGRGADYWRVTYRVVRMHRSTYDDLQAFFETLAFGVNAFLAYDPHKPFPREYPSGFGGLIRSGTGTATVPAVAFDGTATLDAIDSAKITISGLPDNFLVKRGDWVGLVEGSKRALFRSQEDRTSGSNGIISNFYTSPAPLATVFTTAAVVHFERPKALMLLDPEPVSAPWTGPGSGPIIFSASQKVL